MSVLSHLISKIGNKTKIRNIRQSPHTIRHGFAVAALKNGANLLDVQHALGHTSMSMTLRYIKVAKIDLASAHRSYSPVDSLRKG